MDRFIVFPILQWTTTTSSERFQICSLLLVCLSLVTCFYIWTRRQQLLLSWKLPGPLALPFLGNIPTLLQYGISNTLNIVVLFYMDKYMTPTCKMVRFWAGPVLYVLVADADIAFQINRLPHKPDAYHSLGGYFFTGGLVQDTDIDHWRWARKICSPVFGLGHLKSYIRVFHKNSLRLTDSFQDFATSGESFNPQGPTGRYSLITAMVNFFDCDIYEMGHTQEEIEKIMEGLYQIFQHFQNRLVVPPLKNKFIYWLIGLRKKELQVMKKFIQFVELSIVKSKAELGRDEERGRCFDGIEKGREVKKLIQKLLANPDVSYEEARTQLGTMFGAAVDTTKTKNHVLLLMLALHPNVQEKVYNELIEVLGQDIHQPPSYEELMKLGYLGRVLKECMRLMPAVPVIAKEAPQDMTVTSGGVDYTIPAGTFIAIIISSIHNNPAYYNLPKLFDPDRWLPHRVAERHPQCFLPFSSGVRNCLGNKYAMLQMKMFGASIVRKYQLLPGETCERLEDIQMKMAASLKLGDNWQIRLRLRNNKPVT